MLRALGWVRSKPILITLDATKSEITMRQVEPGDVGVTRTKPDREWRFVRPTEARGR